MSTQLCEPEVYPHLGELLSSSIFQDKAVENIIGSPLDGFLGNSPMSDGSSGLYDMFPSSLLNCDQGLNSMPFYNAGGFEMGHIDPSFMSAPSHAIERSSNCLHQNNHLTNYTLENEEADRISSSIISAMSQPNAQQRTSSKGNTNEVKKRRNRKKKEPLPPAAREEKRKRFLEKNRIAAGKCRERNKRKWDRVQEQCTLLEVQNKALREEYREVEGEMVRLRSLVEEHKDCGDEGLDAWIERYKTVFDASKTIFEVGSCEPVQGSQTSRRSSGGLTLDGDNAPSSEDHKMGIGADSHLSIESSTRSPLSKSPQLNSGNSTFTSRQQDGSPTPIDVDMASFVTDDDVPSLLSSRKTSTASISPASLASAHRKIPSPADSGVDMTLGVDMSYSKVGMDQNQDLVVFVQDEGLISDTSFFSLCSFTGLEN
jgi:hypothetical protein